jgi:Tol biopolymer transport system component
MIGKTLAHYKITALLGKGGMGEVYRATDTKLGRDVALKILPRELSGDPERAARFEREARVLASLQHPNIASIYGFENVDGVRFLTMELAEGDDLAQRAKRGRLPLDDALHIASEIAVGLAAAHQRGIIHRDLKPANVKVGASGGVKILDFGLARAYSGDPQDSDDLANSPTISVAMTQAGLILGTAAYMSPEQAKGKPVDQRSDIWSYGVLVFEMLSGRKLFAGETVSETMAEVMKGGIDWSRLPSDTPEWLVWLLRRCLDRDPETRLQSIGEARIAIERREEGIGVAGTEAPARSSSRWPWIVTAAALLGIGAVLVWTGMQRTPEAPLVRSTLLPPADQFYAVDSPFAVSPDGQRIAFVATAIPNAVFTRTRKRSIWVRDLSESTARKIPGTEGAQYPFWSFDARQLGFFANGKLSKVDLRGGPVLQLCDTQDGRGGSWNEDGVILFQQRWSEGLMRIPAGGGTPTPVTTLDTERSDVAHRWPQFLPDGRRFLYFVVNTTSMAAGEYSGVYLGSLDSDETRLIIRGESRALYSEGHLLYRVDSTLMARAIDETSMEFRADPVPIVADVAGGGISWGGAHFGVSHNGVLVSLRGAGATFNRLVWRDREGNEIGVVGDEAVYGELDLSNDGRHLAVVDGSHTADVWLFDLERGVRTRFTFDPADDRSPIWSPDDGRIAFVSSRQTVGEIYVRPVSGNEAPTLLHTTGANIALSDWSSDGRWILYESLSLGEDTWDLMAYDTVEGIQVPVVTGPFVQQFASVSPDGRWLAFTSGESGRSEVYVQPFPDGPGRWMVSTDGGSRPMWTRGGRELVFFDADFDNLFAVEVTGDDSPSFGTPELLFASPIRTGTGTLTAITEDGQRFLANERPLVDRSGQSASLIQNWTRIVER